MFCCSRCDYTGLHFSQLISHYRFVHSHEHGFFVTCAIEACENKYSNVDSYLKHVKRKHKIFYQENFSKFREQNRNESIFNSLMEVDDEYDHNQEEATTGELLTANDLSCIDFQKRIGIFFLSLRERYKLPSVVLPQVINEFLTMISHHQACVSYSLSQYLKDNLQLNADCLKEIVEGKSEVENALSSLDSEYKINKFARFKVNFVKPVQFKMFQFLKLFKIFCPMMMFSHM